ncbi:hypothetical protein BS47DRAFT_1361860 [Hydnum rufescens UP504]|uniref:Uncharacterized protein n=1 Tax=Hydnum rufescens UP504 TaxID=1448309 RepID=A0A9P6DTE0_9AGAM|nr:hypothetical protein BS47DRAFT_1361860 [Hydnum rufescens UP504]
MRSPQTHATTGRIRYHTPTAAGVWYYLVPPCAKPQDELWTCAATQDPITARPQLYATTSEIQYHTPAGVGPPLHQNPSDKSTDEAPPVVPTCAAVKNPEGPALRDVTTPAAAGVVICSQDILPEQNPYLRNETPYPHNETLYPHNQSLYPHDQNPYPHDQNPYPHDQHPPA